MAQILTYKCDICSTVKKEVNHWWGAYTHPDAHPLDKRLLSIKPLSDFGEDFLEKISHLCGFDCVTKWLHQQMQEIINRENSLRTAGSYKGEV